jgi:peptidoglycan/LPS O-acetylase OafA/YrhL
MSTLPANGARRTLPSPPQAAAVAQRNDRDHLDRIDVLRAAAILMVIGFHSLPSLCGWYTPGWDGFWLDLKHLSSPLTWVLYPATFGWSGVALFFVISGFCIHYSFLRFESRDPRAGLAGFARSFFWRRFWRIYPPYLLALICFSFLASRHQQVATGTRDFWLHFFLIHNFKSGTFFSVNPAFWSLALEMQFYLLFPLVLWLRRRFGLKRTFLFFVLTSLACRALALPLQDWHRDPSPPMWWFTLILFVDWLLGAWLAESWFSGRPLFGASTRMAAVLGLAAVVLSWNKITSAMFGFTAFSVWYAVLMELYLFRRSPMSTLEKLFIPVGLCSYSFYLWHQPLIERGLYWFRVLGVPDSQVATWCLLPIVLGIICLWAYISYRVLELPRIALGAHLAKSPAFKP